MTPDPIRIVTVLIVAVILTGCAGLRTKTFAAMSGHGGYKPPVKIAGAIHSVGTSDIAVYLVETDAGLVLFDAAYEHMHTRIVSNIKSQGFNPQDIVVILNTQAHMDHAGGIETLRALSGARVIASPIAAAELRAGSRGDFSALIRLTPFTPVRAVETLTAPAVTVGSDTFYPYATPGHSKGCTTWRFETMIKGRRQTVVLVCGFQRLPFTKLDNNARYPNIKSDYLKSADVLEGLAKDCDVLLAPHIGDFETELTLDELSSDAGIFDGTRCTRLLTQEAARLRRMIGMP